MGDYPNAENPELDAAKRDLSYLLSTLRISSDRTSEMHATCPMCGSNCLQFGPDKKYLGHYFWHCNKDCGGGDIVEAIRKVCNMDYKDAFKKIREDFRGRVPKQSAYAQYRQGRDQEINDHLAQRNGNGNGLHGRVVPPVEKPKPVPVLNEELTEKCIVESHSYLMDNFHLVTKWRRGLTREVCVKRRIGFIEHGTVIHPRGKMEVPAGWILPITNEDDQVKGVRIHFEERPLWRNGEYAPKIVWAPLGVYPEHKEAVNEDGKKVVLSKPRHAYFTMWPHPSTLSQKVVYDFSLDASFWIERIPDTLKQDFNDLTAAAKYKMAFEQSKVPEDLTSPEIWQCMVMAFDEMKQKVFRAVLKTENIRDEEEARRKRETEWSKFMFVNPGELKALACESAGLMATAWTGGEGTFPSADLLSQFSGHKVCVMGDDDPPRKHVEKDDPTVIKKISCIGREWVEKWVAALHMHSASHVCVKYGGRKEQ